MPTTYPPVRPTSQYNIHDWYWSVASNNTIFSSKLGTIIAINDPTYVAWLESGCLPTNIPNYSDLYWVLERNTPALAALSVPYMLTTSDLDPQQTFNALLTAGAEITFTSNSNLNGRYGVSPETQLKVTAIATGIGAGHLPDGQQVGFGDMDGNLHLFSADEFTALAIAIEDYIYKLNMVEATLLAGGSATWPLRTLVID